MIEPPDSLDEDRVPPMAQHWLELKPLYLDTETTGLGNRDEICSIAVLDSDGTVLFESLVKPTCPFDPGATEVNGMTSESVREAPSFPEVWEKLKPILQGRHLVIYNADFDLRMIRQSLQAAGVSTDGYAVWELAHCAMESYAEFYGAWNDYYQSYTWQSLSKAARQCGLSVPANLHHAAADAALCRQIVLHMAKSNDDRPMDEVEAAYDPPAKEEDHGSS